MSGKKRGRKEKIVLGLIALCCMGSSFVQAAAGPITSESDLNTAGGVVTTDATGTAVGGNSLGISNSSNPGGFTYGGDVQINIDGYDLATTPGRTRIGIYSNTTDLTLGKTTLIWRNDSGNTASDVTAYGIFSIGGSTVTLGDGSAISIAANSSNTIDGVYAGGNTGPSGKADLGNQMTISMKNDGAGQVNGIYSYHEGEITVGDDLSVTVNSGAGGAQGLVAGFAATLPVGSPGAIINVGENAKVTVNSAGGSAGIFAYGGGKVTVDKGLVLQVNSSAASRAIMAQGTDTKVELNGAEIKSSLNSVVGTGYSLYAVNDAAIQGNLGKYNIMGDMVSGNGGSIHMNFDKNSYFEGVSRIGTNGTTNFAMDGTTWNMTGNSDVTNLTFTGDASNVVFGGDSTYKTLTVGNLSGTGGNFTMRTDIIGDGAGNNAGDFLEVTGTSAGNHTVTVQNSGSANATGDETLTIIRTADGIAEFTNRNVVELGGYEYNLRDVAGTNKKAWELFATKKSTNPGSAAVNLFSGSYLLNYAETQTLMKRMGDLRDGDSDQNVWGRVFGGKFHSDSDSFLKDFDMSYTGVQVGADKKFVRKDGRGVVYLGGFFGYTKGDLDYGYGSGDVDSKSLGAYWTHMHHNGFYADAVLKYGWMKNDFDVLDSQGTRVTGDDISTRGFTGSLEVGRRYHLDQKEKSGWYVEPQAQLTVSHQNGDHFTASNGLNVKVDAFRSVMGRVGAHVGYEVKGGKNPINVYGKVSVVKEFDGDVDYSFNGSPETTSYKDTWAVYGVGATARLGTRHNLYLDVERATGGQFTQSWAVNGGYRYSW